MTADPAGWPDPARPGVPLNPERDGWHWVAWDPTWPEPAFWDAADREWSQSEVSNINTQHAAYLGPCLTPAEVAAREQAAYQQGWGDREDDFIAGTERSGLIVIAPNDLAAREQAAAEAMRETCAKWHDERGLAAMPGTGGLARHQWLSECIRGLPLPDTSALDAAIQAAVALGMERAAALLDAQSDHEGSPAQLFADGIREAAKEKQG